MGTPACGDTTSVECAAFRPDGLRTADRDKSKPDDGTVMIDSEAIGYAAGTLTTISFIPQAWLSWRTRRTAGLSLGMYAIFALGVALWLGYGVMIVAWPVIVSNAITLALALFILGLRLRHGAGPKAPR
jgi:MtN3 and saliva related transmembrane protein